MNNKATAQKEGSSKQRPSIFDYSDFRIFLREFLADKKERDKNFSYRFFARIAGYSSPSFLKMVMDGQRNISPESVDKFLKVLKLSPAESNFFRHLVGFNQATTADEKQFFLEQIFRSKKFRKNKPLSESQFRYCSKWYYVAVRELVLAKNFIEDPKWISQVLSPKITPSEAKGAIDELLTLGLLKRDDQGKLVQSDAIVTTGDEISSSFASSFHREMMARAYESISTVDRKNRDISAVTLGIPLKDVGTFKDLIQKFRKDLMALATQTGPLECLYQLNFQFFPLTQLVDSIETAEKEDSVKQGA